VHVVPAPERLYVFRTSAGEPALAIEHAT
jgi:hypothetical protein